MAKMLKYKELLLQAKSLMRKGAESLFDRAKILVEVFDDAAFRADHGMYDDAQLAEQLDAYLQDTKWRFAELRLMLSFCSDRKRWSTGKLRDLYDEALAAKRPAPQEEPRHRRTATVAELEAAEDRVKHEAAVSRQLRAQLESEAKQRENTETELERLRRQNAQLREELAVARGRIEELERVLRLRDGYREQSHVHASA